MMARGRTRFDGLIPRLIYLYATISFVFGADYGIPIEIKLWDTGRTPLAHMVDITNEFGLKVIAEHNFLNDNNIAFSPYGLMGILVALYEGVDGESSYQIQRGMQLPWNRNVMRIGFRDIHRTLKTYFIPEEGFLAGLALNNENVTFNDSYKNILRFYGFDLDSNQTTTTSAPELNDSVNMSTTTAQSTHNTGSDNATTTAVTTESVTGREDPSTTVPTKEETTTNPDAETITDIDPRDRTTALTTSSAASNAESTTPTVNEITTFLSTMQQTTSTETTSSTQQTTSTEASPSTQQIASTETSLTSLTSTIQTISTTPSAFTGTTTNLTTPTTLTTSENTETTSFETPSTLSITTSFGLTDIDNLSTQEVTSMSTDFTMSDTTEGSTTMSTIQITDGSSNTTETTTITTSDGISSDSTTTSTLETLERRKRSEINNIYKNHETDDYLIYRSFDIPAETANTQPNTNKMFLVNGLRNVQVTYMHYDTVLEHAYLPHLEASALRLPLDSDRYYLLVVLPAREGPAELGRLMARMARESDLSDVHGALRPRRVRAIVPSFTVRGHVALTTDLQKLGIRDVFEPRQHDFTPMTRQPGVYVRSIEQAVSVAIRKYQPDDIKKNRYVTNRNRVYFSATYPFLYFVMDSSIHVALMAGKMVDPLNTRIL